MRFVALIAVCVWLGCTKQAAPGVCTDADTSGCAVACDSGDGAACDRLGVALDNGSGGQSKDSSKALASFNKGCDAKAPNACLNAGQVLTSDRVTTDHAKAATFFKRACELGAGEGCFLYGGELGEAKDLAGMVAQYEKACALESDVRARACNFAGVAWDNGQGVDPDLPKARTFFQKACDGKDAVGCRNLAVVQRNGRGGVKDLAAAAKSDEQGCALGEGRSCDDLGVEYMTGEFLKKDEALARKAFEKACELKVLNGCTNLGVLYRDGTGVLADPERALSLFKQVCDAEADADDHTKACARYGLMLAETDLEKARPFLSEGCRGGDDFACRKLKSAPRPSK